MTPYAELQVTTNFSFLEGASHPDELALTAASLDPDEKNRVSHRARALRELLSKLGNA